MRLIPQLLRLLPARWMGWLQAFSALEGASRCQFLVGATGFSGAGSLALWGLLLCEVSGLAPLWSRGITACSSVHQRCLPGF